jgi:hypothetical protein
MICSHQTRAKNLQSRAVENNSLDINGAKRAKKASASSLVGHDDAMSATPPLSAAPGRQPSHPAVRDMTVHCKKGSAAFPSPAGMSLTKLFLGRNNLIFPA